MQIRCGIGCYLHSIVNLFNIFKILNNFTNTILFISYFRIFYAVPLSSAIPTDSCEASVARSAHVLCLFEPIGRVTQNMSKKAWRRTGNAACLRG